MWYIRDKNKKQHGKYCKIEIPVKTKLKKRDKDSLFAWLPSMFLYTNLNILSNRSVIGHFNSYFRPELFVIDLPKFKKIAGIKNFDQIEDLALYLGFHRCTKISQPNPYSKLELLRTSNSNLTSSFAIPRNLIF